MTAWLADVKGYLRETDEVLIMKADEAYTQRIADTYGLGNRAHGANFDMTEAITLYCDGIRTFINSDEVEPGFFGEKPEIVLFRRFTVAQNYYCDGIEDIIRQELGDEVKLTASNSLDENLTATWRTISDGHWTTNEAIDGEGYKTTTGKTVTLGKINSGSSVEVELVLNHKLADDMTCPSKASVRITNYDYNLQAGYARKTNCKDEFALTEANAPAEARVWWESNVPGVTFSQGDGEANAIAGNIVNKTVAQNLTKSVDHTFTLHADYNGCPRLPMSRLPTTMWTTRSSHRCPLLLATRMSTSLPTLLWLARARGHSCRLPSGM
jgi:hypothetical protein